MKNWSFVVLIISSTMFSSLNSQSALTYNMPNSVKKEVKIGLERIKENMGNQIDLESYYITLSNSNDENLILISDYKDDRVKKLVKMTNRFIQIDNKLKLPLIFEYDFSYSTLFETKEGGRVIYNKGGYFIAFNYYGKILEKGFSQ